MKTLFYTSILLVLSMSVAKAEQYSAEETVRYALGCMDSLGGQTDENLYTCLCRYESITNDMSFSDYEEGVTFERNKAMPGEKGGFFRENERGKDFYNRLVEVREIADKNCPVVKKVVIKKSVKVN